MKSYACVECANEYTAKNPTRNHCCLDCNVRHQQEAAEQILAREGPYYEKWRARVAAAVLARGLE